MQILDETFDLNKSKQYKLSILLQKGGLSFIIIDSKVKRVIAYKSLAIENINNTKEYCYFLNKLFNEEEFLKHKFDKIIITFESFKSVLVPDIFYSKEQKDELFKLSFDLTKDEAIFVSNVDLVSAKKLFSIPFCMEELLMERFKQVQVKHQTQSLIQAYSKSKKDSLIVLNIQNDFFDMMIFNKHKLLLDNAFKYTSKEDFLYYLLFTIEQLDLDPKKQDIIFYTDVKQTQLLIDFVSQYFLSFKMAEKPKTFVFSYLFSKEDINKISPQVLSFL